MSFHAMRTGGYHYKTGNSYDTYQRILREEEADEAKNPLSFSNTEGGPGYDAQFATVLSSLLVRNPKRRRGMAEAKEEIDRF